MISPKKYNAKLLLFGEHTVLKGSDALAIPFPQFFGKWKQSNQLETVHLRQMGLSNILPYLKEKSKQEPNFHPHIDAFEKDLREGLFFQSNIPLGYGAGSSGALCAAIYDSYFEKIEGSPLALKKIFATLESFFHGSSSGFDPLVCYLNKGIHIHKGNMDIMDVPENPPSLFLVDTGISRSTGPFVEIFLEKCKDEVYEQRCKDEINPLTEKSINSYLRGDDTSLFHLMHDISRYQYLYFNELIPPHLIPYWEKGLKSDFFKMKLCGAGGGGFMMGITKNLKKTKELFDKLEIIAI